MKARRVLSRRRAIGFACRSWHDSRVNSGVAFTIPSSATIADVADTALWVAALRARETRRSRAAFRDPLAALLAGERGDAIARSFRNSAAVEWGVVLRTAALDRLLEEALTAGIDTVINLGAGLDTRPYRLNLPPALRWIEVDLAPLIAAKDAALAAQTPACPVERVGLDLLDRSSRNALFASIGARSTGALIVAEGVIPYFSNADAADLARDLAAVPAFRQWLLDFDNAGARPLPRGWAQLLGAAPFQFRPSDWFRFFHECGWRRTKTVTTAEESARLGRRYPLTFPPGLLMRVLPKAVTERVFSLSGVVMLERVRGDAKTA